MAKRPKAAKPDNEAGLEAKKQELVEKAKKDGRIDQRLILAAIPDTVENAEILDALYTELADANIEITATEPNPENFSDEWEAEELEEEEAAETASVYLDDDVADDSVRLYLREIGKIPLLKIGRASCRERV